MPMLRTFMRCSIVCLKRQKYSSSVLNFSISSGVNTTAFANERTIQSTRCILQTLTFVFLSDRLPPQELGYRIASSRHCNPGLAPHIVHESRNFWMYSSNCLDRA